MLIFVILAAAVWAKEKPLPAAPEWELVRQETRAALDRLEQRAREEARHGDQESAELADLIVHARSLGESMESAEDWVSKKKTRFFYRHKVAWMTPQEFATRVELVRQARRRQVWGWLVPSLVAESYPDVAKREDYPLRQASTEAWYLEHFAPISWYVKDSIERIQKEKGLKVEPIEARFDPGPTLPDAPLVKKEASPGQAPGQPILESTGTTTGPSRAAE